jgi:hypothetical protein
MLLVIDYPDPREVADVAMRHVATLSSVNNKAKVEALDTDGCRNSRGGRTIGDPVHPAPDVGGPGHGSWSCHGAAALSHELAERGGVAFWQLR